MPHIHIAVNPDALAPLIELHADPPRFPGDNRSGYTIKSYIPEVSVPLHAWCKTEAEARAKFLKMSGQEIDRMPTPPPGCRSAAGTRRRKRRTNK